jgi:hypothetical protein
MLRGKYMYGVENIAGGELGPRGPRVVYTSERCQGFYMPVTPYSDRAERTSPQLQRHRTQNYPSTRASCSSIIHHASTISCSVGLDSGELLPESVYVEGLEAHPEARERD